MELFFISFIIGVLSGGTIVLFVMKKKQRHLIKCAYEDFLTGLPNRVMFHDHLKQAILLSNRKKNSVGILFIDLDRFKPVNDNYGHAIGDELLRMVGERLLQCVRAVDTVARLGGDEFAIILTDITKENAPEIIAQKIIESLSQPFNVVGHFVSISVSVGIAVYPKHGEEIDTILKRADEAMFQAKKMGRSRYCTSDSVSTKNINNKVGQNLRSIK
jgi:diguanylate cyclase (GGDEF)-like protein